MTHMICMFVEITIIHTGFDRLAYTLNQSAFKEVIVLKIFRTASSMEKP
jgi:uncharacterized protein involved in response to NO